MSKDETLRHDPDLGEVDPRTYPLVGCVRLASTVMGSNERVSQANRLIYAIDKACEQSGEPRVRVHLTMSEANNPRERIEAHIQPLTHPDPEALCALVKAQWKEISLKGEGRWVPV